MKDIILQKRKIIGIAVLFAIVLNIFSIGLPIVVAAEESDKDASSEQIIDTEYGNLWKDNISVQVGRTVKWYVNVPEGTALRGCGATIKIPGLGWGTDSRNKDEGHLTFKEGNNYVYEFTPEKTGDILFTCWMGSGCHSNYIHVTEDGTYTGLPPAAPTNISVHRNGTDAEVSFTAPVVSENVTITGFSVLAVDEDGKRVRAGGDKSPITLTNLNKEKTYTITVTAKSTAGIGVTSEPLTIVPETNEIEKPVETKGPVETKEPNNADKVTFDGTLSCRKSKVKLKKKQEKTISVTVKGKGNYVNAKNVKVLIANKKIVKYTKITSKGRKYYITFKGITKGTSKAKIIVGGKICNITLKVRG